MTRYQALVSIRPLLPAETKTCFWMTTLLLLSGLEGSHVVLMPESQPAVAFPGSGRPLWALPQQHAGRLQEVPSCLARRQPKGSSRAEGPDQSQLLSKWPFLLREHPAQSYVAPSWSSVETHWDLVSPGCPHLPTGRELALGWGTQPWCTGLTSKVTHSSPCPRHLGFPPTSRPTPPR